MNKFRFRNFDNLTRTTYLSPNFIFVLFRAILRYLFVHRWISPSVLVNLRGFNSLWTCPLGYVAWSTGFIVGSRFSSTAEPLLANNTSGAFIIDVDRVDKHRIQKKNINKNRKSQNVLMRISTFKITNSL